MSGLYRMAFNEHKQINIDANDCVIISASAIPGNETTISRVIDEICRKGAEVIYDRHTDLHVSGHASQEEQKMVLALTKPRFFIPVHGEYRMLCKHADIAHMMGVDANHTVVAENGSVIELSRKTVKVPTASRPGAYSWTAAASATSAASCCATASTSRRTA